LFHLAAAKTAAQAAWKAAIPIAQANETAVKTRWLGNMGDPTNIRDMKAALQLTGAVRVASVAADKNVYRLRRALKSLPEDVPVPEVADAKKKAQAEFEACREVQP
jgi:hypothetical protein